LLKPDVLVEWLIWSLFPFSCLFTYIRDLFWHGILYGFSTDLSLTMLIIFFKSFKHEHVSANSVSKCFFGVFSRWESRFLLLFLQFDDKTP